MKATFAKFAAVATVALGFAFALGVSAAGWDFGPATLRVGSTGVYVSTLQTALNSVQGTSLSTDGNFGPMTKSAVIAFQSSKGLTADGVVGNMTKAALNATSGTNTTLPAGCTPGAMFSSTTGIACTTSSNGGTSGGNSGPLQGGAGDLDVTSTSTDVEDTVKEGDSEKILGFKAEADGSDIAVTSVKVTFVKVDGSDVGSTVDGSKRLDRYVDEVSIMLGDDEVGTIDADEFSKDGDEYSKSISLSGAVVDEDDEEKLYVSVKAASSIDTDDMVDEWNVVVDQVRFEDATGATFTASLPNSLTSTGEDFDFEDADADDDLAVQSSSNDPDSATLEVEEDQSSDDYMVFAFKLDVDDESSDITINDLPIVLTVANGGTDADSADAIFDEVKVKIGGETFEADLDSESITNGTGSATYLVEFSDDEFVIDSGDDAEVEVWVTFNDQDGNYDVGTTVQASVTGSAIDAEGEDELNASGSSTGDVHTLSVDAPMFELDTKSFTLFQAIDGVASGEEDVFRAQFNFTVTAGDEDIYLSSATNDIVYTQLGGGSVDSVTLDADDDNIEEDNSFKISSGSSEEFTLSFYIRGNNESDRITIDSFAYGFSDATSDDETVSSGLTEFKTNSVYLAK